MTRGDVMTGVDRIDLTLVISQVKVTLNQYPAKTTVITRSPEGGGMDDGTGRDSRLGRKKACTSARSKHMTCGSPLKTTPACEAKISITLNDSRIPPSVWSEKKLHKDCVTVGRNTSPVNSVPSNTFPKGSV